MQIAQASARPLPVARRANLIVKELPDETLIYDLDSDEAHCLNQTAALVWENCDGRTTIAQLVELLCKETGALVTDEVVWLALGQLEEFHLLESAPPRPEPLAHLSRRQLVRTIGATLVLPAIISIVAPTAQAQTSPGCKNQPCVNSSQCCAANPTCNASNTCK